MHRFTALAVLLAGCGLVLDDPLPFQAAETVDAGRDAQPDVQRAQPEMYVPRDMAVVDAAPDAAPPDPDARPADAAPDARRADAQAPDQGTADACTPGDEVCNGVDDDCDGEVDESYPEQCEPCGAAVDQGICGVGAFLCVDGGLRCLAWLPDPGPAVACDLLDNDCDGTVDEAGEAVRARTVLEERVATECGARPDTAPPAPEADCTLNPRVVGCSAPHACVAPGCRRNCEDTRTTALGACSAQCRAEPDPLTQAACWGTCRRATEQNHRQCLARCGEVAQQATRWACAGGEDGAVCTAIDCPEGMRPAGQGCEPNVEICNNGVDDDGDGLIDGTASGPDPCMVTVDQRANPQQMGLCPNPDQPGCEDTRRMAGLDGISLSETCGAGECPRTVDLTYAYSMDREEVSIRAYHECVLSGCCLPPSGRTYQLAVEAMDAGLIRDRPASPERCAPSVDDLDPRQAALLADLPVTGVTWCQARDYCNWVGKRLPTEYEWERAAAGIGERRVYAWGDDEPAQCPDQQCCRAEGYEGGVPGLCDGGVPVCPANPPAMTRLACMSQYGYDDGECATVRGPAPVYANADGATPDGFLNLTGNVSEWVFDWDSPGYGGLNDSDPAGAACDESTFPFKRMTRGQAYTSTRERLRVVDRNPLFDSTRAPLLGFRCGRTLVGGGGVCNPRQPEVPAACNPGADVRRGEAGRPQPVACGRPDYELPRAGDGTYCSDPERRVGSGQCTRGLESFCTAEGRVAGCGSFVVSRMRLPNVIAGDSEIAAILNTVFDATLAPRGGDTLFAISVPENFAEVAREWPASIGSAEIDANGNLSWQGVLDQGICDLDVLDFRIRSVNPRQLNPVCRALGTGRLWFRASPVSIGFSGFGMNAAHEPAAGLLSGTLAFVITLDDVRRSTFGTGAGQASTEVFERLGIRAENLCNRPIPFLGIECFAEPLLLPGCNGNVCTDPDTCTGFMVPFEFEAIRAPRAGLVGLDACGG